MAEIVWPKDQWGLDIKNIKIMQKLGFSEIDILKEEIYALNDLIESLPTGLCDMDVHIYCDPERYCLEWPEV